MSEGGSDGRGASLRRWAGIIALIGLTSGVTVLALEATTARAFGWGMRNQLGRLDWDTLALGTGVVAILVAGLFGLTGRLRWGIPLAAMTGVLLVAVNYVKIRFRSEPLYPSDFAYVKEAGLLVDSVGIEAAVALGAVVLLVGVVTWLAVVALGKLLRVPPAAARTNRPRWVRWARATAVTASIVVVLLSAGFSGERSVLRTAFDRAGAQWVTWSQNENFRLNGFLAGFLYNMPTAPMQEPDGYSRAAVDEVVARWAEEARRLNATRDAGALTDTNVVIILGESFMDPTRLDGLEMAEDPLPFTRGLGDSTVSGTLRSVAFGGGTANVEFEVLTGMATSHFKQTQPPYQGLVSSAETFPSVLGRFEETHTTLGIHPFVPDFYRRGDAYRSLGLTDARFRDDMASTWKVSENGYVADGAAYEELVGALRASTEPVFAQVVTMQNHAGYAGLYPDPIPVLAPASATDSWGLSDYLRGLRHADEALETLLADLAALDEDTVVLFYGDHAPPSVIPDDVWDAQASDTARFETPWFVWSSAGVDPWRHEGLLSPTLLWNQVLGALDAPLTPWDALLMELERESAQLGGPGGDPSPAQRDHLLLQYDLAVGAGYAEESALTVPAP